MLKVNNISKSYGRIKALDDISFEVGKGDFVFIIGPSGAGKTTLLNLILRKFLPTKGEILLDGEDITQIPDSEIPQLRQKIGVVFQDFKVLPQRTVRENVEVALAVKGVSEDEWQKRVDQVLELVGLRDRADLFPSQLSGGELQRVSLARALAVDPDIILADEPTGNLDWETADEIVELFEKVNKDGKTIIMATHHKAIVDKLDKRIIELKKGKNEKEQKKENKSKKKKKKKRKKEKEEEKE